MGKAKIAGTTTVAGRNWPHQILFILFGVVLITGTMDGVKMEAAVMSGRNPSSAKESVMRQRLLNRPKLSAVQTTPVCVPKKSSRTIAALTMATSVAMTTNLSGLAQSVCT